MKLDTQLDAQQSVTHIHRFRDRVALSVGHTGKTVYITPSTARSIANRLYEAAMDVDTREFGASQLHPVEIYQQPGESRPVVIVLGG